MKRILLVRLSSLGDVLHTFPAVTDLVRARPEAVLEWVVEEAYVPLVQHASGRRARDPVCAAALATRPRSSAGRVARDQPRSAMRCATGRTTR